MRFPMGGMILLALASGSAPAQETAQRIAPRPLRVPVTFRDAERNGTRTEAGEPGPNYWQQDVDYTIRASLDVSTGVITGSEVIIYRNNSPDTLRTVVVKLEQNVFSEGARRNRRAPITGGVTIDRIQVNGGDVETRYYLAGSTYYEARTLLLVDLRNPLATHETVAIEIDWRHVVPPSPTFRTGNQNGDVFAVGQWYPKVSVYDDVYGWDTSPYLGDGEFYLEYGNFDVRLTVPAGWLIGATGTLANAEEVLAPDVIERLDRAAASETVVQVVGPEGSGAGPATSGSDGQTLTWHFSAENVRDFAWSTSSNYLWDAVGAGGGVVAHALYRPQLRAWNQAARYAAHAIRTFSRDIGEYVYPQITVAEGPIGGMEYPMIVFNPSSDDPRSVAGVTIHEVAHQWFPMTVGNIEGKHAWMDEGFVSYWEELSLAELWGEDEPRWGANQFYLAFAGTEAEVPLMRHTDLVNPHGERTLAAYTKPAVILGALREVVGDDVFLQAFRDFFESWKFKHPQPWDFFNTFERHAGADLDWFWRPLFFETDVLDHAVESVAYVGGETTITIRDNGDVILPTPVTITMEDGSVTQKLVAPREWLDGGRIQYLTVDGRVSKVELDPEFTFPDVNRDDNVWEAGS